MFFVFFIPDPGLLNEVTFKEDSICKYTQWGFAGLGQGQLCSKKVHMYTIITFVLYSVNVLRIRGYWDARKFELRRKS